MSRSHSRTASRRDFLAGRLAPVEPSSDPQLNPVNPVHKTPSHEIDTTSPPGGHPADVAAHADPASDHLPGETTTESCHPSASGQAGYLVHVSRQAMACQFEVIFSADRYPDATPAASAALDRVDQLEDLLSSYRPHSQLCQVNRQASREAVRVEPELAELLSLARQIAQETCGAFDPTCGPLSAAWGFLKRAGHVPSDEQLAAALRRVGYERLQLDPKHRTVRFLTNDLEINVNAIGKGYALDRAAALLEGHSVGDFLLHGGQSSVLARGTRGGNEKGWTVGLRHPLRPTQRIAEFLLIDQALGTSGSATQSFHALGKRFGHVIDPRSGRPAEDVYSATVIAPTAALADALSTAFYVMGPAEAQRYCREHPSVGMLLVCPSPESGEIEIHAQNLEGRPYALVSPPRIEPCE